MVIMWYFSNLVHLANFDFSFRIASQPDSLPKLDWTHYKNKINVPGLVDSFQKSYESMQIPYPTDQGLISKINEQEKEMKDNFATFSENINKSVKEWKEKLAELEKQIPFSEMTMEEYWIARPEAAVDPVNFPTLYPHNEPQIKYTKDLIESGKL